MKDFLIDCWEFLLGILKSCLSFVIGIFIVLGIVVFSVVKCTQSASNIDNYHVYIEDNVRYTLASAHPKIVNYNSYNVSSAEKISRVKSKIADNASSYKTSEPGHKLALERIAKEGNSFERDYASSLLRLYKNLKIDLTPLERVDNTDKYTFQEKNSKVHFSINVGIIVLFDADTWDIMRYTEILN